jgi:6-phosphofructokinase 1
MGGDVIGSVVEESDPGRSTMRVAMLTGGGDCPGLNAVMRAVVRKGERQYGDEVVGFRDGWRGVLEGDLMPLTVETMRGTLPRGGTILGSSRTNPYKVDGGPDQVRASLAEHGIDALVAIGGEDTLGVAHKLSQEGVPVLGVPKTIDNDLSGTELTFGFDTAVQICVDAIDRLHTTAESHNRVMVVEVMGRHAGHIAAWSGIAGGATITLIPEEPFDIEAVCDAIRHRHEEGRRLASIVVVSEGATPKEGTMQLQSGDVDAFGHVRLGGIGTVLSSEIEERTGFETRVTTLGHVQRGGTPTAYDRVLATRFGVAAIDAVHDGAWGTMVALQGGRIVRVSLEEAVGSLKLVEPELYDVARVFFE